VGFAGFANSGDAPSTISSIDRAKTDRVKCTLKSGVEDVFNLEGHKVIRWINPNQPRNEVSQVQIIKSGGNGNMKQY